MVANLNPLSKIEIAGKCLGSESAFAVLRIAWHMKDSGGDPLTAAYLAHVATNIAAAGYTLGIYTLSTATRVRLFAKALGGW